MTEPVAVDIGQTMAFGPFRLLPARHVLLEGGEQVALGSRAFDILVLLVERAGQVVGKEELIARAWPDTIVEEGNLRVQIASVRRALREGEAGSRYLATIPGRGYSFVAPVAVLGAAGADSPRVALSEPLETLPLPSTRIIGRADAVNAVCTQLPARRFVTLVGPGGIGKTTVAIAAARALAASYRHGVTLADFSRIGDPRFVPQALAAALNIAATSENAMPTVIGFLREKEMLLVLDSCEHVIEAAALAAEDVYREAPAVHVLATSQEPLRAEGERVHRLAALETPGASADLTAAEALSFSAVQLFVERAAASTGDFDLSDADAPFAAEICRRLDGMALAIELAAGRVAAFGIRELASRLDDRFRILTGGRRTALPRHQTLLATLEWSFQLLPESERALLCRLSVFAGAFTLESAIALAGDHDPAQVLGAVADLTAKSLVVVDRAGDVARYRLQDTTRLFGLEKLKESDAFQATRRSLAVHLLDFFAHAAAEAEAGSTELWLKTYGRHVDDIRAALEWAFSDDGDVDIALALTTACLPLWVQLSRVGECREWAEKALLVLGDARPDDSRRRMQLSAALGWSLMFAVGRARETSAAWTTALALAEQLGDHGYRLRALWGLWVDRLNGGQFSAALDLAGQFVAQVTGTTDAIDLMMADRMVGTSLHYTGDQKGARLHITRMFARGAGTRGAPPGARFQFDQHVTAHYFLARILWLQGFPDQALREVGISIEKARPLGNMLSFASVLGQGACPLALLTGDLAAAQSHGAMLSDHADRFELRLWGTWARCFIGLVTARQGDVASGLTIMRAELAAAAEATLLPRYLFLIGEYAAILGEAGEVAAGMEVIARAMRRCEDNNEAWYGPELIRINGDLLLLAGAADAATAAEREFRRAIDLAQRQDAPAWALRAAISLARLPGDRDGTAARLALLADIYAGFSEGHGTADLVAARDILSARAH